MEKTVLFCRDEYTIYVTVDESFLKKTCFPKYPD